MTTTTTLTPALSAALDDLRTALGPSVVLTGADTAEFTDPYEPLSWGGQRSAAVVQPASTAEVQAVVRIANTHRVPLWVGSQGRNNGYGGSAAIVPGSIVVNLRRMDKVLEVNDELCYVVVEPGVSFNALYERVQAEGKKVMIDVPDLGWGSVIGNTCDHGFGYTKYGDHFGSVCGIEVVLPTSEVLRTGMGGLEDNRAWHVYRSGFGPNPEGLFLQSNLGIITRMGVWVMPQPETYMDCQIHIATSSALPPLINALRPLMIDGTIPNIPSFINTAGILSSMGPRSNFHPDPTTPIPESILSTIRAQTGIGAWMGRFALYGRPAQVAEAFSHIQSTLSPLGDITVTGQSHSPASLSQSSSLSQSTLVQAGIPTMSLLSSVSFAGSPGGHIGFSSILPLTSRDLTRLTAHLTAATQQASLDYTATITLTPRALIHTFILFLHQSDTPSTEKAYAFCREMVAQVAEMGYGEHRAHVSMMDLVAGQFSAGGHAQRGFNERVKDTVDPEGVLMPGRAGIWGTAWRGRGVEMPWGRGV
ncbi:FAD-binding oxidoreductase [Staphylotrichum tortipilum]|uniref:FAD-binding oxidoreductase n=1 Tax=Staphylotrichum tortipilum TaxID=2831512 RepID=A0AAN6MDD3_9PEZI|nr:FAD-binding oxidoreductase [Staphylotrichum longicolle]